MQTFNLNLSEEELRNLTFDYSPQDFQNAIANLSLAFLTNGIDPEPYKDDFFKLKLLWGLMAKLNPQGLHPTNAG